VYILLTYDIQKTTSRTKVATLLEGFGVRVNFSVFELDIKKQKLEVLLLELKSLCGKHDSVRVYRFSQDTIADSYELNDGVKPFEKGSGYVD